MSRRVRHEEDGWVLVIAMVVMTLMLALGLSYLSQADTQQKGSRQEREKESALNLAEGVLYSQSFILALPPTTTTPSPGWPGAAAGAYAGPCDPAHAGAQCPDDSTLANTAKAAGVPATFQNNDTGTSGAGWTVVIQDNGAPAGAATCPATGVISSDYANAAVNCHWDANGDNRLWIRSTATIRGRTRTVVGLMQIEAIPVPFPRAALTAGTFDISNQGNHGSNFILDSGGTNIFLRCGNASQPSCADYNSSQLSGGSTSVVTGASANSVLGTATLASMKQTALANHTYYPAGTCPTGAQLTGETVYVENCTHTYGTSDIPRSCTWPKNGTTYTRCINGYQTGSNGAGTLVWARGVLSFDGQINFVGVVYHLNSDGCGGPSAAPTCPAPTTTQGHGTQTIMVSLHSNATVIGAIAVDGLGGVDLGSNGTNLQYDPNVFNDIDVFGTTGLVQNSWREL